MGFVIYSVIPYMIWLGIGVFIYKNNLKKGKDTFQVNQLGNVIFSSISLASFSSNADFTKGMIVTMIGLHAVLYLIYFYTCLYIRWERKMFDVNEVGGKD